MKSNDLRGSVCELDKYVPVVMTMSKQYLLLDFLGGKEFMQAASQTNGVFLKRSQRQTSETAGWVMDE